MSRGVFVVSGALLALSGTSLRGQGIDDRIFKRGDANNDNTVNVTDAVFVNSYLFSGGPEPPCMNQADANDSGVVDMSDSVFLLNWLYSGGSPPPSPGPYNSWCTVDALPRPGCYAACY